MGAVPPFLGTPEDFQELIGQFLRFREMVKLTRIGETHPLKPVMCIEITLRQMEHMVVVEKIPGSGSDPRRRARGQRASQVSWYQ